MPYKSRKAKIEKTEFDRRIKLTEEDKNTIRKLHKEGVAIRQITRMYKVSRRLIQFTVFPERLERNKENFQARGGWKACYNHKRHVEAMRNTGRYKHKLFKENKIKIEEV